MIMRIAYDYQIFGAQRYGGISRYFYELSKHLSSLEDCYQTRIFSPIYVNDYLQDATQRIKVTGVHMPVLPRTGRAYRALNGVLTPMLCNRWNPDIVHETYYSKNTVARRKSRIVLTVYDMIHELFPEHFPVQDQTRHAKRIAVERADHIICISEHTRQDLIRLLDIPSEKTTVVHLGFSLTNSNRRANSNIGKPYILFVGVRGGYKNFSRLLAAYASDSELSDAFDLVAFGGGKFSNEEQLLIKHHGLNQGQVHQVGGGDEVLAALYKDAALFVYPSLYEGFGIPPLEAMSLDCPVACSNTSSIPEIVGEAAYLFDPHSSESISRAIQAVLGNTELRSSLQRQGQERVRSFSWQTCAAHTLDVYKAALS